MKKVPIKRLRYTKKPKPLFSEICHFLSNNHFKGVLGLVKQNYRMFTDVLEVRKPLNMNKKTIYKNLLKITQNKQKVTKSYLELVLKLFTFLNIDEAECVSLIQECEEETNERHSSMFNYCVKKFYENRKYILLSFLQCLVKVNFAEENLKRSFLSNFLVIFLSSTEYILNLRIFIKSLLQKLKKSPDELYLRQELEYVINTLFFLCYFLHFTKSELLMVLKLIKELSFFSDSFSSQIMLSKEKTEVKRFEKEINKYMYILSLMILSTLTKKYDRKLLKKVSNPLLKDEEFIKEFGNQIRINQSLFISTGDQKKQSFFSFISLQWSIFLQQKFLLENEKTDSQNKMFIPNVNPLIFNKNEKLKFPHSKWKDKGVEFFNTAIKYKVFDFLSLDFLKTERMFTSLNSCYKNFYLDLMSNLILYVCDDIAPFVYNLLKEEQDFLKNDINKKINGTNINISSVINLNVESIRVNHFSKILMFFQSVYSSEPKFGRKIFNQKQIFEKVHDFLFKRSVQFITINSHIQKEVDNSFDVYLNLLATLSKDTQCGLEIFRKLNEPYSKLFSWLHFFDMIKRLVDQKVWDKTAENKIVSILKLIEIVVKKCSNITIPKFFILRQDFNIVQHLSTLTTMSSTSPHLMGQIYRTLSSFVLESYHTAIKIWTFVDQLKLFGDNDKGEKLIHQLNNVEARMMMYPENLGFLYLINKLIHQGIPIYFSNEKFLPYFKYIKENIFERFDERKYRDIAEKWKLISKCLKIFIYLVKSYDPSSYTSSSLIVEESKRSCGFIIFKEVLMSSKFLEKIFFILFNDSDENEINFKEKSVLLCLKFLNYIFEKQESFKLFLLHHQREFPPFLLNVEEIFTNEMIIKTFDYLYHSNCLVNTESLKLFTNISQKREMLDLFVNSKKDLDLFSVFNNNFSLSSSGRTDYSCLLLDFLILNCKNRICYFICIEHKCLGLLLNLIKFPKQNTHFVEKVYELVYKLIVNSNESDLEEKIFQIMEVENFFNISLKKLTSTIPPDTSLKPPKKIEKEDLLKDVKLKSFIIKIFSLKIYKFYNYNKEVSDKDETKNEFLQHYSNSCKNLINGLFFPDMKKISAEEESIEFAFLKDFEQNKTRMLKLLNQIEFSKKPVNLMNVSLPNLIKIIEQNCIYLNSNGIKQYNINKLYKILMHNLQLKGGNMMSGSGSSNASASFVVDKPEIKAIIQRGIEWNKYYNEIYIYFSFFESWKECVEIVLQMTDLLSYNVLFDLIISLFSKLTVLKEIQIEISKVILKIVIKIRKSCTNTKQFNLPKNQFSLILNEIINSINRPGIDREARNYLYLSLSNFLQVYFITEEYLKSNQSYLNLIQVLCKDSLEGINLWKTVSFSTLSFLLRDHYNIQHNFNDGDVEYEDDFEGEDEGEEDELMKKKRKRTSDTNNWIRYIQEKGYLHQFLDIFEIQEKCISLTNKKEGFENFFIFENLCSLLIQISPNLNLINLKRILNICVNNLSFILSVSFENIENVVKFHKVFIPILKLVVSIFQKNSSNEGIVSKIITFVATFEKIFVHILTTKEYSNNHFEEISLIYLLFYFLVKSDYKIDVRKQKLILMFESLLIKSFSHYIHYVTKNKQKLMNSSLMNKNINLDELNSCFLKVERSFISYCRLRIMGVNKALFTHSINVYYAESDDKGDSIYTLFLLLQHSLENLIFYYSKIKTDETSQILINDLVYVIENTLVVLFSNLKNYPLEQRKQLMNNCASLIKSLYRLRDLNYTKVKKNEYIHYLIKNILSLIAAENTTKEVRFV